MPWKAKNPVDLRVEFIGRLLRGERMTDLCGEYGISRRIGHKLKNRYEALGVAGLEDQSRAPKSIPHKTTPEMVALIVEERKSHPSWGPKKLKAVLEERVGQSMPSASTIGAILERAGLHERRRNRVNYRSQGTEALSVASEPNDVWCTDYKGQFRLGDQTHCYPLTTTDLYSRYILSCEGMAAISDEDARAVFLDLFRTYGLPKLIRSDNGVPFASVGLAGLTKLNVFWMRAGVRLERIRRAHPEENGQHERMHRTLKRETTRPARQNLLQQQERFDEFLDEFNGVRPHEALGMKRPAQVYKRSCRAYPDFLPDPTYPLHDDVLEVGNKGMVYFKRQKLHVTSALAGQLVGVREEDDGRWLVTFLTLDLGHIDSSGRHFSPSMPNPPPAA